MKKVFIDVGANKGQSLDIFLTKWPDALDYQIVCIEADSRLIGPLSSKIEEYKSVQGVRGPLDIELVEAAAWITNGEVDFYQCTESDFGSSLMKDKKTGNLSKEPTTVPCIDLAKLLLAFKDYYVVLKMDVEGAEYIVLDHLIKTGALEVVDKLYLEFHNWKVGKTKDDDKVMIARMKERCPNLAIDTTSYNGLNFA